MQIRRVGMLAVVACLATMALAQAGQQSMSMPSTGVQGKITNLADDKFGVIPGTPQCMTGAVQNGDPAAGAFVVLLKFASGCTVPMHWHSANEELMFVSGTGQFQMKGDEPHAIGAGGYVYGPAKHPHQMTCTSDCMLYLRSDGAFDIHYIDKAGNDIPMEQALAGRGQPVQ